MHRHSTVVEYFLQVALDFIHLQTFEQDDNRLKDPPCLEDCFSEEFLLATTEDSHF